MDLERMTHADLVKLAKLQEEQLKTQFLFEDTYALIQDVVQHMPIKNFEKGYTLAVS
mgnify:CR=1 FL=1